ncbi:MAG TPA: helix-turn-helix domain-containing protein [Ktedonobacteraceae bacterium]|nr:helix-turn-helix domain-containing protein [Ktedonobacteraceae bacterium]
MSKQKRAYKYRFSPTDEQKRILAQTFGCCRFVYNWLRHEVVVMAVETAEAGFNLVFYYQYPTRTRARRILGWEASRTM